MRKIYHICFSSHDEVMFRNERDYVIGFNCLAEAAFQTESKLLADGLMSTHWHSIVQTEDPLAFVRRDRYAYTRYFNAAHGRSGRLGERQAFITEIEGIHRLTAALNYVNRQGLHHGITATPFGYPHCSANAYFCRDLGKVFPERRQLILPERRYHYLVRGTCVPARCRMDSKGLLLREDIIDTAFVEQVYLSPRNYLFQMNKPSDERSVEDQRQEKSTTPLITIDVIEAGTPDFDVKQMLVNEQGRVNKSRLTDQEVCRLIDDFYVPWMKKETVPISVYACTLWERESLFETVSRDLDRFQYARDNDKRTVLGRAGYCGKTASTVQLKRCLLL